MTTPEQAQASLERERDAYWKRKRATSPGTVELLENTDVRLSNRSGATRNGEAILPNRADGRRHGRYRGVTKSQRRKPAKPTFAQLRKKVGGEAVGA